ncbi:MAG: glycosyltransferase family 39 protein [Polyangiaceae bacterium]
MGTAKLNPTRWVERIEQASPFLAIGAGVWFFLATAWELFGPLPGGHLGNATGAAIAGENMLRWHVFGAALEYTAKPPVPAQLYCHHPYGVFIAEAISHAIFGHGWASVKLPALVMSALTPWLLYRFARSMWGAVAAAIATLTFTLIPIDLAFSSFSSLEVMVIFFGLLFSWATARLWQTWRAIYLLPATIGALGACHSDWVGLVLVGTVGIMSFVRVYVLTPSAPVSHERHAKWFAWVTAAAVSTLLLYIALFAKAGKLGDLLSSAEMRSAGANAGWRNVFGQRRVMWVLLMLPLPALAAIAIGPLVSALRTLGVGMARRKPVELIAVAWMIAASFQYFVFRQGADVHIFWPHYFGVVAALGFGVLAEVLTPSLETLATAQLRSTTRATLSLAPLSLLLLGVMLIGRVGVVQLAQSRLTGGRFDDGGRYIAVDQDRARFVEWAVRDLPAVAPSAFIARSFTHGASSTPRVVRSRRSARLARSPTRAPTSCWSTVDTRQRLSFAPSQPVLP